MKKPKMLMVKISQIVERKTMSVRAGAMTKEWNASNNLAKCLFNCSDT